MKCQHIGTELYFSNLFDLQMTLTLHWCIGHKQSGVNTKIIVSRCSSENEMMRQRKNYKKHLSGPIHTKRKRKRKWTFSLMFENYFFDPFRYFFDLFRFHVRFRCERLLTAQWYVYVLLWHVVTRRTPGGKRLCNVPDAKPLILYNVRSLVTVVTGGFLWSYFWDFSSCTYKGIKSSAVRFHSDFSR